MGFELIAHAYGSRIETLSKGLKGFETFRTRTNSQITQFESHDYAVWKVSQKHFKILAESDSGIEMFKHNTKPVLGVQFHPELGGTLTVSNFVTTLAH